MLFYHEVSGQLHTDYELRKINGLNTGNLKAMAALGYYPVEYVRPPKEVYEKYEDGMPELTREGDKYTATFAVALMNEAEMMDEGSRLLEVIRSALNAQIKSRMEEYFEGYPEAEVMSFERQRQEAEAWAEDHDAEIPFIALLAEKRGLTVEALCEKILINANAFEEAQINECARRHRLIDQAKASLYDDSTLWPYRLLALENLLDDIHAEKV